MVSNYFLAQYLKKKLIKNCGLIPRTKIELREAKMSTKVVFTGVYECWRTLSPQFSSA
jgi:hypothetical protein